ncbi:MAG: trypsin-like peptidase domain-containing protein [Limisphaerales bacterium]
MSRSIQSLRLKTAAILTATLLLPLPIPAKTPDSSATRRDQVVNTVEQIMPCVVNIATEEVVEYRDPFAELFREFYGLHYRNRPRSTRFSLGSGVIIDEEGYVLTNLHVVQRATKVWVQLADGREFEAEPIVGTSRRDVALLRLITPDKEKFTAIQFAPNDDLLLGETVLALGNPFGLGGSVSRGILSSKNRRPSLEDQPLAIEDWLQTDAAINPGSSGGPLVNLNGQLIGLNVAVHREGQGIGFAIPIRQVSEALTEIFTPEVKNSQWFGARFQSATLPLTIHAIDRTSPAEKASLQPGDTITAIQNTTPRSFIHAMLLLTQNENTRPLELQIQRQDSTRDISLQLQPLETLVQQRTGATAQEMDALLAQQFGLPPNQGLLISHVQPDSPAAKAGLEPGYVISAINNTSTPNLLSAATTLAPLPADELITLNVIVERQRGPYRQMQQARVQLRTR